MSRAKIEEVLEKDGFYMSTVVGTSMYPMLRSRRDTVLITPCSGRLRKYDVALYKSGERYVLHRIVEVREDSYVALGDHCAQKEYGITDREVLGVMTAFYRDGKEVSMEGLPYRVYVRVWQLLYPLRRLRRYGKGRWRWKT